MESDPISSPRKGGPQIASRKGAPVPSAGATGQAKAQNGPQITQTRLPLQGPSASLALGKRAGTSGQVDADGKRRGSEEWTTPQRNRLSISQGKYSTGQACSAKNPS